MSHGYDTHRLIIETRVMKQLAAEVDKPELFLEIMAQVRELAFRRITVDAFNEFCNAQPCLLWQPEDKTTLINVRVKRQFETVPIKVYRIMFTICHVRSEQGEMLRGHEEVHHICGKNGTGNNAWGACLNPAHLFRGNAEVRKHLHEIRETLKKRGLVSIHV